jgi:hypothetical protein
MFAKYINPNSYAGFFYKSIDNNRQESCDNKH